MKVHYDKLIFELSVPDRKSYSLPKNEFDGSLDSLIPKDLQRSTETYLPEVSENDIIRHYTNLSSKNYGVDTGFYPLGSCTMKYNPKINEDVAAMPGFSHLHPHQEDRQVQGALEMMFNLQGMLSEITGMDEVSLNPFAGAHGELAGLMIMKAYHENRKDFKRKKIIVPDSAHGTNPASASVVGYETVEVKSNPDGTVNVESLKGLLNDEIAGIMLTNPNTLGIFEKEIHTVAKLVHEAGGLLYYDGANLNAIMGKSRPGDMGFDIIHLNLHKTFSTPHGGGGPGSGPVGVKSHLGKFLPNPKVVKTERGFEKQNSDLSIGNITGFYGNFGIYLRAYTYILTLGRDGLKEVSETAVLNANYLQKLLQDDYVLPIKEICKHEFVLAGLADKSTGVKTLDIAKRLLDFGYHAPTIYFPLIVNESIMIEPTDTESKQMLDNFVSAMKQIAKEAKETPEVIKNAPVHTPVRRLDEAKAARNPIISWKQK